MRTILLIMMACLGCMGLPAFAEDVHMPNRTLELSTSSDIKVAPNIAYMNIAVTTQAMTAKEAAQQNATQVKAVVDALGKALGASGKLQTGSYQVMPTYQYDEKTRKSKIVGYEASNQVQIQTTDLQNLGQLVDVAVKAGSNQVQSIQFSRTDIDALTTQAVLSAIQKAKSDAEKMATAAGVSLDGMMSLSTVGNGPGPLYKAERMMVATGDAQTPVIPGEMTISGTVHMIFAVK